MKRVFARSSIDLTAFVAGWGFLENPLLSGVSVVVVLVPTYTVLKANESLAVFVLAGGEFSQSVIWRYVIDEAALRAFDFVVIPDALCG